MMFEEPNFEVDYVRSHKESNIAEMLSISMTCFVMIQDMQQNTFGAKVALESSWGNAFDLADPSNIEGSSLIRSFDPAKFNPP